MPRVPLAGRDDLDGSNVVVKEENRPAASGSGDGSDDDDDDTGPRLVIVSHAFSRAQQEYVEARHKDNPNAPIFYKDATPRAEHYVRCGVEVSGVNHGITVPAKLEVCFCDGVSVNSKFVTRPGKPETEALKILGDGERSFDIEPGKTKYFDYRIEVGSLRADDRKFCVKVVPNAEHVAGVLPAVTPGLLVLSKKRLTGEGPGEGDPVRKRRKAAAPPPVPSIAYEPLPLQPSPYALPVIPPASLPVAPPAALPAIPPPQMYSASDVLSQTREILARVGALERQVQHLVGHVEQLVSLGWSPPGAASRVPGGFGGVPGGFGGVPVGCGVSAGFRDSPAGRGSITPDETTPTAFAPPLPGVPPPPQETLEKAGVELEALAER